MLGRILISVQQHRRYILGGEKGILEKGNIFTSFRGLQTVDAFNPAAVRRARLLRAATPTPKRLSWGWEPGAEQPFEPAASEPRGDIPGAEVLLSPRGTWVGRQQSPDGKRDFPDARA